MLEATPQNSSRSYDINGWVEVQGNPISKVGIFPYLGKQIDDSLEPNKIYRVFRPPEELNNPETIESFKLVPLINDHEMLGAEFTPAENKGIEGIVGENVYFEEPYLKANLKIFSEQLKKVIDGGKKELSIGYRCKYDLSPGFYNGVPYDVKQHTLRGNHTAVVKEGRAGPDVAVLDHFKLTFDEKGMYMENQNELEKKEVTLESINRKLDDAIGRIAKLEREETEETEDKTEIKEEVKDEEIKEANVEDEEKVKAMDEKINSLTAELLDIKKSGLKSLLREVSDRNKLVERVSPLIGTFDHADLTIDEVAKYALDKLNLKAKSGQEYAVLEGYLAAKTTSPQATVTMDAKPVSDVVTSYFKKCV
jgi:hypothetical protein